VLEIFEPREHQIDYYKYTKEGWNISDKTSCEDAEYSQGLNVDFAAASRAIACLELVKQ